MRKSRPEQEAEISDIKCRNKELVMHMSNLPVFLQHGKENSVQGKALNFGVLDWSRLEKWKYSELLPGNPIEKGSMSGKSIFSTNREVKVNLNMGSGASSTFLHSGSHLSSLKRQCELSSSHLGSYESTTYISERHPSNESPGNRLSDFCSPRLSCTSKDPDSSIQDFCPKKQDNMLFSSFHEDEKPAFLKPEASSLMMPGKATKPSSCVDEFVMQSEFSRKPGAKGKRHTLLHKVRFSLGRITGSSSFRDSSSIQRSNSPCSSVISSRSKPECPSTSDSRLRRFLDPLFKRTMTQSCDVDPVAKPSQRKQEVMSKVHAFLQLTLKNEVPLYKLVVEASNSMVVAAATKAPISGKHDQCLTYTFYTVCDTKKKSTGWISKGSSSKACSLAYNVIGQMEISTTCGSKKIDARECVLYVADPEREHSSDLVPHNEIAAVIANTSSKKLYHGEGRDGNGTVVILPAAIHSTPIKGMPSSLISRWRSGGSCDCGGWDVGCKLRILGENLQESTSSTIIGDLNLFPQGESHMTNPVFTMEQLKTGLYSVIFDDSIPLLEAFGICVAHLTCQTCHFLRNDVQTDTKEWFQVQQCSMKYSAACRPSSPASRI